MKNVALVLFIVGSSQVEAINFKAICPILGDKPWAEIIQGATEFQTPISGKDSGVLNDKGTRRFLEKNIPDCGDGRYGISLRFTQDRVGERGVYEVFLKSQETDEVIAFAYNNLGKEIQVVPPEVATDKTELYGPGNLDRKITTREGCFRCHGDRDDSVSYTFDVKGAEAFWKGTKAVKFLAAEKPGPVQPIVFTPPKPPEPTPVALIKPEPKDETLYTCKFEFWRKNLDTQEVKQGEREGSPIKGLKVALRTACATCMTNPVYIELDDPWAPRNTDTKCFNPTCVGDYGRIRVTQEEVDKAMHWNDCEIHEEFGKSLRRK